MSDLEVYERQNMGNRSGWGQRPALLIIDFTNGFADPDKFGGGNIQAAIDRTADLLVECRRRSIPVAFTKVVYAEDGSDNGVFCLKAPGLAGLTESNPDSEIVDELAPYAGEYIIRKQQPSAFFGTGFQSWLTQNQIDTIIHTGCTTSGCVRASVIDGLSHNYRNIVVTDCVGDRAIGPHDANLFDMGQKYADLLNCSEVIEVLGGNAGARAAAE